MEMVGEVTDKVGEESVLRGKASGRAETEEAVGGGGGD